MTSLQHKGRLAAVILAAVILCAGCDSSSPTVGAGLPVEPLNSAAAQTQTAVLATDERLPVIPQAAASECVSLLPEQPIYNDNTARILAYQITQYCGPDGVSVSEFSDSVPLDYSTALKTALYHTGAVLLPLEYSAKAGEYACPAYPNHELFRLFLLQSAPCEFFYRDDAMAKVEELFGEDFLPASQEVLNPFPFTYYTEEEVFAKPIEEPPDTSFCPVILSWRESGKRICVTALMGKTQGAGCPITVGGIVCTAENIESLKAQNPLHSFTFEQQADGRLVLKGYQVVSFVPKDV